MTETSGRHITRGQWITIAISSIAILLTFTGINYQTISSGISRLISPTADFTIESYSTPQTLPQGFLYSLNPASDYYVVTSIHLGTNTPYVGNPFYFSVSFDNKGKKSVLEPSVMVYLVDMFSREWVSWNHSLTNGEFSNGFSLAYNFPTLDQKTTGSWVVITLLYSNATGELVSVNTTQFNATDNAPQPAWVGYLELGIIPAAFGVLFIARLLRRLIKGRKKTQPRKTKRAEKEEKEGTS
jgi:hypothetical protein